MSTTTPPFVFAGEYRGAPGSNGADGANVLPTDEAVAERIDDSGSLSAMAVAARVRDGSVGAVVEPSGDTTGATDWANIETALAAYGGVQLTDGHYYVRQPVRLYSGNWVRGKGMRRTTVHQVTNNSVAGACFWTGHYHPDNNDPAFAGVWTQDATDAVANNAVTVHRPTVGFTIAIGDLVMIKTYTSGSYSSTPHPHLRRVTAVSVDGKDITVHKPLDGLPTTTRGTITKGAGGYATANIGAGPFQLPTYLAERTSITDLAVDCPYASWLARTAVLEGEVRNIYVITSQGIVFGNAFTDSLFQNLQGNYRTRCVEITDGGRGNTIRKLSAVMVGGQGYATSDPVIKMGHGDTLVDFDITDYANDRLGSVVLGTISDRNTIRDGVFRLDSSVAGGSPKFQLGNSKLGHTFSNVTVDIKGVLHTLLFSLSSVSDINAGPITLLNPAGRDSGAYTINIGASLDRITFSGFNDVHNPGTWATENWTGAGMDKVRLRECSWRSTGTGRTLGGSSTVTLLPADQDTTVTFNRSGNQTAQVSVNSTAQWWAIGTTVRLRKTGSGTLNVVADATGTPATLNVDPSLTLPVPVNTELVVTKTAADTFLLRGTAKALTNVDNVQQAPITRTITAGAGLTGGGDLTADRTLAVAYGTGAGTAAQGNDSRIAAAVPNTRNVSNGYGITGGGDLSADRTLAVGLSRVTGTTVGSADVSLPATTLTTVVSITLTLGTWDLKGVVSVLVGGAPAVMDAKLEVGTAAGSFEGAYATTNRQVAAQYIPLPISAQFVCTTAGTVLLRCYASAASTAKALTSNGYAGATGLTAVRIA